MTVEYWFMLPAAMLFATIGAERGARCVRLGLPLRWNTCVRMIERYRLRPADPEERVDHGIE